MKVDLALKLHAALTEAIQIRWMMGLGAETLLRELESCEEDHCTCDSDWDGDKHEDRCPFTGRLSAPSMAIVESELGPPWSERSAILLERFFKR